MDKNLSLVVAKKPALKKLITTQGNLTVYKYFKGKKNSSVLSEKLLLTLQEQTSHKIESNVLLHTADHIGILNHPFFWTAKACFPKDRQLVVLATSNISPSNSSHPRSLVWHDEKLTTKKSHFVSLNWRRYAIYGMPSLEKKEIDFFCKNLPEPLKFAMLDCFKKSMNDKWLGQQLASISAEWFKKCLDKNIVYIELETIINRIILDEIKDSSNNLCKLFFKKEYRDKYLKAVNGISGAHDHEKSAGSQLFWLLDPKTKTRQRCKIENNLLVSANGISIELNKDNIENALDKRILMPTLALSYCILAFEHGATLTGGFSQIDYLGDLKEAWISVFPSCKKPSTDIFCGEMSLISVTKKRKHKPATLADIYLNIPTPVLRVKFIEKASQTETLENAISNLADELAKIVEHNNKDINYQPTPKVTLNVL